MDLLQTAFVDFREKVEPNNHTTFEILDRLEHDERMIEAWPKVTRRVASSLDLERILFQIVAAVKQKAEVSQSRRAIEAASRLEHQRRCDAVATLNSFLAMFPDNSKVEEIIAAKDSLAWIDGLAKTIETARQKSFYSDLPTSRKANSLHVLYCKALCAEFYKRLETPLCDFVGIVTPVVFGTPGRIDEHTVRQAWREEKRSREQGNPKD